VDKLIVINDLYYRPIGTSKDILKGVNLELERGDFVLLLGSSGCGKSILVQCLNGLIPQVTEGEMKGSVLVDGFNTQTNPVFTFATKVGMVFQNPDDQILSLRVIDEVAWGVENTGIGHDEIVARVKEFMEKCEISHLANCLTFEISGGQKQKVSIASNLAMCQDVLILDDPTTDLDPIGKSDVVNLLWRIFKEGGRTFIVIEHELNDIIEMANRIVIMDDGKILYNGEPALILAQHYDRLLELGVNMPQHVEIIHAILKGKPDVERYPIHKTDAFVVLKEFIATQGWKPEIKPTNPKTFGESVISVRNLHFAYNKKHPILRGLDFDIQQGEFVAIVGANGSGKSTLVNNLVGLLSPDEGSVVIDGRETTKVKVSELARNIGYVFQNPDQQLFTNFVSEEVGFSLKIEKTPKEEVERRVKETLEIVGLSECADRHPFSLSRGQRQKLAVATALVHDPRIMLLDEPTTGQDRRSLSGLLDMMVKLNTQGNTTLMVTHDMDIVAAYASRVIVMSDGQIVMDGRPEDIFYDNFDELARLRLRPPTVVDFCRRLKEYGVPRFLTCEALLEYLDLIRKHTNFEVLN
jgi:energy-coupling factor transport system ATP-binding protein